MADTTPPPTRRSPWTLILCLLAVLMAISAAGYRHYQNQKYTAEQAAREQIEAIGNLKAQEIARWLRERQGDVATLFASSVGAALEEFITNPAVFQLRQETLAWISSLVRNYGYSVVALLDASGQVILSVPLAGASLEHQTRIFIEQVLRTRQVVFSDLYRDGTPHLDLIVPLLVERGGEKWLIGALLLRVDPREFLFLLLKTWPTPSPTAETLLVRREGDEIVFLNELRHRPGAALSLRLPLSMPQLPAARAVRGEQGEVDGIDYRGVEVLAAIRKIPNSPWYLVAKVDRQEIEAPIRASATRTAIIAVLLMLVASLLAWIAWRRQAEAIWRELNKILELRIQARTAELRETNQRLEQEIVERRQMEHALRESEARFRRLVESNIIGIISGEHDLITEANDEFLRIVGYNRQDLAAGKLRWPDLTPPEYLPLDERAHEEALKRGACTPYEKEYVCKDGTRVPVLLGGAVLNLSPILNLSPFRWIAFVLDLTARKQAEEALRQMQAQLAHMSRFSLAGAMAGGLAHEINQPLAAIANYTEACLLLIRSGQVNGEPLVEAMEKAAAQAQRAGEIIHRLRNLMRRQEPQRSPVAVNELVQEVVRLAEPEARQQGVQLRLELTEPSPVALADNVQIQQVVLNLARNAIEALVESQAGRREVIIKTAPASSEAIEVAVSDTGPGLSADALNKLFMPFFTTKATGMGLGLSISRSIIETYGGRLWAMPNPERGATFYFTLPSGQQKSPR